LTTIEYPECVNLDDRIVVGGRKKIQVVCPNCKGKRYVRLDYINYGITRRNYTGCCHKCLAQRLGEARGEKSGGWKGGKRCIPEGYIMRTIQPNNPFFCMSDARNGIREHRLIMAEHLGRPLLSTEVVHHVDGNKTNNQIKNLVLLNWNDHTYFENALRYGKVQREDVFNYAVQD